MNREIICLKVPFGEDKFRGYRHSENPNESHREPGKLKKRKEKPPTIEQTVRGRSHFYLFSQGHIHILHSIVEMFHQQEVMVSFGELHL